MIVTIIVAIVLGGLFGLWLNKQAYDELKVGKKWFAAIIWTMAILLIIALVFFRNMEGFDSLMGSIFFLATVAYSSYKKSGKR